MGQKKVMKLATEGKRLGAFCIDAIVPVVVFFIMTGAGIVLTFAAPYNGFGNFGYGYGYGYNYGYGRLNSGGTVAAFLIAMLILIAYAVIQIVCFTKAKTIGKAALGLQVISSETGEPVGFWKMLFREWIVKRASASIIGLGYIWVIVDDKNRGWHDKILDTYVVDLKESAALNTSNRQSAAPKTAPSAPAAPVRTARPSVSAKAEAPVVTEAPAQAVSAEPETIAAPVNKAVSEMQEPGAAIEAPEEIKALPPMQECEHLAEAQDAEDTEENDN